MAFNVQFYTFGKKERSTAQPTGQGTVYSCTANDPLDLLAPEIILKISLNPQTSPTAFNYAYIPVFSRYYRVTGWSIRDGLWHCSLAVDALASWKTAIGSQSTYVYRSAYASDGAVVDPYYPTKASFNHVKLDIPDFWSLDVSRGGVEQGGGRYVLGILGKGAVNYYCMTQAQVLDFLDAIFDDAFYTQILGGFGATEYPEAKVAINPIQYVTSFRFYPTFFAVPGTAWAMHITGGVSSINVGPATVQCSAGIFTAVGGYADQISNNSTTYTVPLTNDADHPQISRGSYLRQAPYTTFEIFMPPWGFFQVNSSDLIGATGIKLDISVDMRSGSGSLNVYAVYSATSEQLIARYVTQVGIDCPLTYFYQVGTSNLRQGFKAVSAAFEFVRGRGPEAITGPGSFVADAVMGDVPHVSVEGNQASGAQMCGRPCIQITHRLIVDEDNTDLGRPLCKIRQLSTIPGYIKADSDGISLACTDPEMTEIRAAISDGFYYE